MARTLTSANAVLTLSIDGLFPAPVQIRGFSTEDMTNSESVTTLASARGVDGRLSFGFQYPDAYVQNIMLQGDSDSIDFFDIWFGANSAQGEIYVATGSLAVPSLGKRITMIRGGLQSWPPLPSLGRTVRARTAVIHWSEMLTQPY
jgi:hypothetical protein